MTGPVPFNINAPLSEGKSTALLPRPPVQMLTGVYDVDGYVEAMKAMVASAKSVEGSLMEAAKALGVPPQAYSYSSMSFMPDTANAGLMQWPGINPDSLRKICRENVIPRMVFNARVNDIARYARYASEPWETGWYVHMRDARDKPTAQDRADMAECARFIANCCRDYDRDPRDRDAHGLFPFDTFMRMSVDDIMTFDGWAIWTERANAGYVKAFAALPAGNIRLANPRHGYRNDPRMFAALLDETGSPVEPFTRDELIWRVQYPRTDPSAWGYGWPLPEQSVRLVQAFQSGVDLNASTFDRSGLPNAILKLKGDFFNQDQVDALMREWSNMKRGVTKVWTTPVIAVPEDGDIEVLNLNDIHGTDIRYRDHLNLMAGCFCIVCNFPSRRLGLFASGHSRDNMPLPNESVEVQGTDDPGLPPLLNHIEATINPYLVQAAWPRLAFAFRNKDPKSDARGYEMQKLARTWAEGRRLVDQPDLDDLATGDRAWLKPLVQVMALCPEDPSKTAPFQTLATVMLQDRLKREAGEENPEAEGDGGRTPASPGAPFAPKKDPAAALDHGHRAGVRRPSRRESAGAGRESGAPRRESSH